MSKATFIEPKAGQFITEQMREKGELTRDEAVEIIRPHFMFDGNAAREQFLRRKANYYMAKVRDENGVRICFSTGDESHKYINVDKSVNKDDLNRVEIQLKNKTAGLRSSLRKVRDRLAQVSGQVSFDDVESE